MIHSKYFAAEVDFLWNLSNYWGKYNENRFYSFIPYLGVGYGHGWDYKLSDKKYQGKQRNFTINGGIINKFRLSNRVALDVDLSAMLLKKRSMAQVLILTMALLELLLAWYSNLVKVTSLKHCLEIKVKSMI